MRAPQCRSYAVWVACSVVLIFYAYLIFRLMLNAPHSDDFFDTLLFLILYHEQPSIAGKLLSLFWEYVEHIQVTSKLISLLFFTLFGRIDFFYLACIGSIQLPLMAFAINAMSARKHHTHKFDTLICLLFVLCPSIWLHYMITAYTTIAFAAVFLPVLLVYFIKKQKIAAGIFTHTFLLYTLSSGIFMTPISNALIWSDKTLSKKRKTIFTIFSCLFFIIYLSIHKNIEPFELHTTKDYLEYSLQKPLIIIGGVAGFVGSLTFMDTDAPWPSIFSGSILLIMMTGLLYHLWKNKDSSFGPIASLCTFFLLCLCACSITRVATYNLSPINDSHYKLYSLPLWAIVISGIYRSSPSQKIRALLVFFSAFVFFIACIRYMEPIFDDSRAKQEILTEWSISGKRESLGYTAMLPYSHEALLASIRYGYYSPFDSRRGALDQPAYIQETNNCAVAQKNIESTAIITNNDEAIAFSIQPRSIDTPITEIMLCSNQHAFIIGSANPTRRTVIDKSRFPANDYHVLQKTTKGQWAAHPNRITVLGKTPQPRCDMSAPGYRMLVVAPVVYALLCPQAKTEPYRPQ